MRNRYTAMLGILGVTGAVLATRVASAGPWGTFWPDGTEVWNENACGFQTFIGDGDDGFPNSVEIWAHNGQIRAQAVIACVPTCENPSTATNGPLASGTTWMTSFGQFSPNSLTHYRCQNL
jgi:hypothetical protein